MTYNRKNTQKKEQNIYSRSVGVSAAVLGAGIIALASGLITGTASAHVGVSASVQAARLHASTTLMRTGSSTRMSSTTRRAMLENRQTQTIGTVSAKSGQEISSRIASLNALSTRLSGMTNLSATEKSTLSGEITSLINELTGLSAKIQADASSTPVGTVGALASTSPLRQDFASITKDYRVYALVIPQTEILAAADRVDTIVASLTTLSAKLQTRITAGQSNGGISAPSATSLQATLADLNAKTSDARTEGVAAVNAVSGLIPDNGNTTVAARNEAALKTGRAGIQTAQKDIAAADKDAHALVSAVEKTPISVTASTTNTVSSQ